MASWAQSVQLLSCGKLPCVHHVTSPIGQKLQVGLLTMTSIASVELS